MRIRKSLDKDGFTLIELLVVISIIALLSSVVLSSLNSSRAKARLAAGKQFASQADRVAGELAIGLFDFDSSPADKSSVSGTLTYSGNTAYSADTPWASGSSLFFDGSGDYALSASNLPLSGDAEFSMCAWIKWNGAWSSDYPSFMGNNSTGAANQGLSFTVRDGRPAVDFWVNRFRATSAITADEWHHVCGTKSPGLIGSATKLYVDGVQVAGAVEGSNVSPSIVLAPAVIGRLDGSRYFNGWVDSAHFFAKTLVASEVRDLYAAEASAFIAGI